MQVSMLLYAAETDNNLPPVMSSMAYPFEPRQVYQHPQTYTQLSPVQENLYQEHMSVLPDKLRAVCWLQRDQFADTCNAGLRTYILTEAMSSLE